MSEVASGPDFRVWLEGKRIRWSAGAREADSADARVFAAALLAGADKADRRQEGERYERDKKAQAPESAAEPRATSLDQQIWLTTKQAGAYTGYHRDTVLKALEAGELSGSQRTSGGRWRIHRDALDAWMRTKTR